MRVEPASRYVDKTKEKKRKEEKTNGITRKVAIGFVLLIIIFLFFKMMLP
jgi:hypothetical protein